MITTTIIIGNGSTQSEHTSAHVHHMDCQCEQMNDKGTWEVPALKALHIRAEMPGFQALFWWIVW